jgi:hypothetical protein
MVIWTTTTPPMWLGRWGDCPPGPGAGAGAAADYKARRPARLVHRPVDCPAGGGQARCACGRCGTAPHPTRPRPPFPRTHFLPPPPPRAPPFPTPPSPRRVLVDTVCLHRSRGAALWNSPAPPLTHNTSDFFCPPAIFPMDAFSASRPLLPSSLDAPHPARDLLAVLRASPSARGVNDTLNVSTVPPSSSMSSSSPFPRQCGTPTRTACGGRLRALRGISLPLHTAHVRGGVFASARWTAASQMRQARRPENRRNAPQPTFSARRTRVRRALAPLLCRSQTPTQTSVRRAVTALLGSVHIRVATGRSRSASLRPPLPHTRRRPLSSSSSFPASPTPASTSTSTPTRGRLRRNARPPPRLCSATTRRE